MNVTRIRPEGHADDLEEADIPVVHSWDPNSRTGYPLFTLMEKGVPFDHKFYDLRKFEEGSPEFLAINPKGILPAVVHRGQVFTDYLLTCEYLDAALPGPSLVPADPMLRYAMRRRCRLSDDIANSVSMNGWNRFMRTALEGKSPEEIEEIIMRNPARQRQIIWRKAIVQGFSEQELTDAHEAVCDYVLDLNDRLADRPWLTGTQFTLADIVSFANFYAITQSMPEAVAHGKAPHFMAWLSRCYGRPRLFKTFDLARTIGTRATEIAETLKLKMEGLDA